MEKYLQLKQENEAINVSYNEGSRIQNETKISNDGTQDNSNLNISNISTKFEKTEMTY